MWYFIIALLLGLGCPSGSSSNNNSPTFQTNGGNDTPGDPGGDTGQTPPPKPLKP